MTTARYLQILTDLCNLPTAPYAEQHVLAWLLTWASAHPKSIRPRRDPAGNLYLEYRPGRPSPSPLVIEAHMDHPGFLVTHQKKSGAIAAEFRGGVKASHFKNAKAKFWLNDPPATTSVAPVPAHGRWIPARITAVKQTRGKRALAVSLTLSEKIKLPPNTLGMWDLPEAGLHKKSSLFAARVCDDLAGVAAIVCTLEQLIAKKSPAHVIGLCTRAEEVGFAGVLALCEKQWLPKSARVIGLETSKASTFAAQGEGPVIRVGDRTGIFSPGLTHFLTQAAGHLADADPNFRFQRKLMDGGTCNSTAFTAFGYDSAGICVALGNYHNMSIKGDVGYRAPAASTAGPGIASETIHLQDFIGMVQILVETASRIRTYKPGFGTVRDRLAKMHRDEQRTLLYKTSDTR